MNVIDFVKDKKRQILELDDQIRAKFLHTTIFHETYLESRCLKRNMRLAAQYEMGATAPISSLA